MVLQPTCFLRSSGSPAPPQAGAGCAGMARSGCLAAASSVGAAPPPEDPHPLVLLMRFTEGSLPLFSFLHSHDEKREEAMDGAAQADAPICRSFLQAHVLRAGGRPARCSLLTGQVERFGCSHLAQRHHALPASRQGEQQASSF